MHIHDSDFTLLDKLLFKERLENKILNSNENARSILYEEIKENPEVFIESKIGLKNINDFVVKKRKKLFVTFNQNEDIPKEIQFLSNGNKFYL